MRKATSILGGLVVVSLLATSCGDDDEEVAGPTVAEAQAEFCAASEEYIAVLDRYGRLFDDSAVTIGDVQATGDELTAGRDEVEAAAEDLRAAIAAAEEEQTSEGTDEAADAEEGATTTTAVTVEVSEEAIARLEEAEDAFDDALGSVDADTPLSEAVIEVSSAAYALQVSWQIVLAQAGCIEDLDAALAQVIAYTSALQTDLATAGFYEGPIDGIYGPETVAAVKALQESAGLPVTGKMDRASQAALSELLAEQESAQVAALQGLLAGVGYWDGPIDGVWSEELAAALASLQSDLGLEPTGTMDPETLSSLQAAVAAGTIVITTPPTTAPPVTTAPPTTAPPTTAPGASTTAPAVPPTTIPAGPGSVVDVLEADGRFATLLDALEAAGLTGTLAGEGLFTLFAPTDDAFAAVPPADLDALLGDPAALEELLLGHAVVGAELLAEYLAYAGTVTSAAGTPISVAADAAGTVTVNGTATVTTADVLADNGVVHVLDAVLLAVPGA